jgi:uncharacterized protein YcbK (DUF882 family)
MKLTENFKLKEFQSKDGAPMPQEVFENIVKLANQLQFLRNHLKNPIKINSAYRSPEHNARVGGVPNSQHVKGKAADIVVKGMSTVELYNTVEKLISSGDMLEGGLGLYDSFVHYDIRGERKRWDKRSK